MKMTLPITQIQTNDGKRIIGYLFFETSSATILLNNVFSKADFGILKSKINEQFCPEASITIIPKNMVKEKIEMI